MNTKLLTLAATGVAGITLGLGVGVAAAQGGPGDDRTPPPVADVGSMDEMHAMMRDQMPAELADACNEMHASMPAGMASMHNGLMNGAGGMNGAGDMSNGQHQAHHK